MLNSQLFHILCVKYCISMLIDKLVKPFDHFIGLFVLENHPTHLIVKLPIQLFFEACVKSLHELLKHVLKVGDVTCSFTDVVGILVFFESAKDCQNKTNHSVV
jgi:hypothetical protein